MDLIFWHTGGRKRTKEEIKSDRISVIINFGGGFLLFVIAMIYVSIRY